SPADSHVASSRTATGTLTDAGARTAQHLWADGRHWGSAEESGADDLCLRQPRCAARWREPGRHEVESACPIDAGWDRCHRASGRVIMSYAYSQLTPEDVPLLKGLLAM